MTDSNGSQPISGINAQDFSSTVRAQDDFFRYVNGPWIDKTVIPADRVAHGSFYALRDAAEENVRAIIEDAPTDAQIGSLYRSFMDLDAINARGAAPLQQDLAIIEGAANSTEFSGALARLQRDGLGGVVAYGFWASMDDPDRYAVYLMQSGIGLPDEAYYREEQHAELREQYQAHIARMAEVAGVDIDAASVLALETELASHHWDVVETRDAEKTNNPTTLDELIARYPGFAWSEWAAGIALPEAAFTRLVTEQPSYFEGLAQMWTNTPLDTWKNWARWVALRGRAAYLSDEISKTNFDFYGTVLNGQPTQRTRWKRGVGFVESILGEVVGQEYVKRHFPSTHKQRMDELVTNLIAAWRQSVIALDWMSEETKEKALKKLEQFSPKIGYPEKWRDFSDLEIVADDLVGNVRRASAFDDDWAWARIDEPVDREEWHMTPQTVNAYYNPLANEIVFPAAILQPPFFNVDADDAVNYGAIGSVIGHEIGHGFDDQGSKFDGHGALASWWSDADREEFEKRAGVLIEQYNGYSPKQLNGEVFVNGALTIGENIGDLAGVISALRAYEIALGTPLDQAPVIDGLTGVQRFFLGYALTEQDKIRDEALKTRIATDPHSPSEFRVNGILRNIDAWHEAFEVGEDDALYLAPEDRVRIW